MKSVCKQVFDSVRLAADYDVPNHVSKVVIRQVEFNVTFSILLGHYRILNFTARGLYGSR